MSTLSQFFGGSSGGGKWKSQTFTSSGSWVAPAGVEVVRVLLVGGGGGGHTTTGGCGGGGGEIVDRFVPVTPGTSYAISIGAGGLKGSAGLSSTFGSTILIARGGSTGTANTGGNGGGLNHLFSIVDNLSKVSYEVNHGGINQTTDTGGCVGISSGQSISGGGGGAPGSNAGNVIGYGSGGGNGGGGASYGNGANTGNSASNNTGGGGGSNGSGGSGICIVYWVE